MPQMSGSGDMAHSGTLKRAVGWLATAASKLGSTKAVTQRSLTKGPP
jgi:hypothetical protein